jgi:hypothetical protein
VNSSPKIAFILGIIHNIILILFLIYDKMCLKLGKYQTIILYVFILFVIKVIPLFIIRKDKLKIEDVLNLCFLFLLYNLWLFIQRQNIVEIQEKIFHSILYNTKETPLIYSLNK